MRSVIFLREKRERLCERRLPALNRFVVGFPISFVRECSRFAESLRAGGGIKDFLSPRPSVPLRVHTPSKVLALWSLRSFLHPGRGRFPFAPLLLSLVPLGKMLFLISFTFFLFFPFFLRSSQSRSNASNVYSCEKKRGRTSNHFLRSSVAGRIICRYYYNAPYTLYRN